MSMNTATLKRIRKTKDANERDRLHFVGHVEDGMGITKAAALLALLHTRLMGKSNQISAKFAIYLA